MESDIFEKVVSIRRPTSKYTQRQRMNPQYQMIGYCEFQYRILQIYSTESKKNIDRFRNPPYGSTWTKFSTQQQFENFCKKFIKNDQITINFSHLGIGLKLLQIVSQIDILKVSNLQISFPMSKQHCRIFNQAKWDIKTLCINSNQPHLAYFIKLSAKRWPNINSIYFNQASRLDMESLAQRQWNAAEVLEIKNCKLTDKSLKLFKKENWKNLIKIHLGFNKIGPKGMREFVKIGFSKIETLQVQWNHIGNEGLSILAKGSFPKLKNMCISKNNITDLGFKNLIKGSWNKLRILNCIEQADFMECENNLRQLLLFDSHDRLYLSIFASLMSSKRMQAFQDLLSQRFRI